MSKKTTGAHRAYIYVAGLPVGKSFTTREVYEHTPEYTTMPSIGNLLYNMRKAGYLRKLDGKNEWVITPKTKEYGADHKFTATYNKKDSAPSPKLQRAVAARARVQARKKAGDSFDVIDELLSVMAKAEPELRRLKKLDEEVKKLTSRLFD